MAKAKGGGRHAEDLEGCFEIPHLVEEGAELGAAISGGEPVNFNDDDEIEGLMEGTPG